MQANTVLKLLFAILLNMSALKAWDVATNI